MAPRWPSCSGLPVHSDGSHGLSMHPRRRRHCSTCACDPGLCFCGSPCAFAPIPFPPAFQNNSTVNRGKACLAAEAGGYECSVAACSLPTFGDPVTAGVMLPCPLPPRFGELGTPIRKPKAGSKVSPLPYLWGVYANRPLHLLTVVSPSEL
jgi:hypothetical protein